MQKVSWPPQITQKVSINAHHPNDPSSMGDKRALCDCGVRLKEGRITAA